MNAARWAVRSSEPPIEAPSPTVVEPERPRRPIELATDELLRRIHEAWPDHVNKWRLSLGGAVLASVACFLVGFVALVTGTPTHMLKMTLLAASVACVLGPLSYHLLCAVVPKQMLLRDIRSWTFELCRRHALSPVESQKLLDERAQARIRELELL